VACDILRFATRLSVIVSAIRRRTATKILTIKIMDYMPGDAESEEDRGLVVSRDVQQMGMDSGGCVGDIGTAGSGRKT